MEVLLLRQTNASLEHQQLPPSQVNVPTDPPSSLSPPSSAAIPATAPHCKQTPPAPARPPSSRPTSHAPAYPPASDASCRSRPRPARTRIPALPLHRTARDPTHPRAASSVRPTQSPSPWLVDTAHDQSSRAPHNFPSTQS